LQPFGILPLSVLCDAIEAQTTELLSMSGTLRDVLPPAVERPAPAAH